MFSVFEKAIVLHISFSMPTLYNLNALLELCDVSVPDFSMLQTLPSFGGLN